MARIGVAFGKKTAVSEANLFGTDEYQASDLAIGPVETQKIDAVTGHLPLL